MDIFLIRHGERCNSTMDHYDSDKKIIDPPLTEKGIRQAEKLADRCKSIGFDMIFSSDYIRAVQTAEKLVAVAPCEITITPDFREIDMGAIHARSWNDFPDLYAKWVLHDEDIPYPNGENGEDVWNRCKGQIEKIVAAKYKKVAVVCHGGTIRCIVCGVLGIPQQQRFYFGAPPENCSISILKYNEEEERFYLHTFNDYSFISD